MPIMLMAAFTARLAVRTPMPQATVTRATTPNTMASPSPR